MFSNILVPLDGSGLAERALPYATRLLDAAHGRLTLFHATSDVGMTTHPNHEMDIAVGLEALAARQTKDGVLTGTHVVHGDPASAILDAARAAHNDLIVMSTHGRSGLGRWLCGSVAEDVLRQVEVPLLLIPATCSASRTGARPLKILVPLDGSDRSEAALSPARMLADRLGGTLLLVRIAEPAFPDAVGANGVESPGRWALPRVDLDEPEKYLSALTQQYGLATRDVDTLVDVGSAESRIAAVARQEEADLIVMATHGRGGLDRLTMGSVAEATLHRSHVPILLVRPTSVGQVASAYAAGTSGATIVAGAPADAAAGVDGPARLRTSDGFSSIG